MPFRSWLRWALVGGLVAIALFIAVRDLWPSSPKGWRAGDFYPVKRTVYGLCVEALPPGWVADEQSDVVVICRKRRRFTCWRAAYAYRYVHPELKRHGSPSDCDSALRAIRAAGYFS